uniref:Uncharacterized protein n=1 Tax=viral metagenome TaxID=1070528 RepID=A0A6M3LWA4_9ZZZZ
MNYSRFTPVPQGLLETAGCSTHRVRVYGLLLRRSRNGNRLAYGGRISVSKLLGISQSTVQEALSWLETAGVIRKTFQSIGGRGIANVYRVIVAGYRAVRTLVSSLSAKLTDVSATRKIITIDHGKNTRGDIKNPANGPPDPRVQHIRELKNQIQNM